MNPLNQLLESSIAISRIDAKLKRNRFQANLTYEEKCEAWKQAGLFDFNWPDMRAFCHGKSGRFFYGKEYIVWYDEMKERYGSFD